jgi:hypothetical protein
VEGRAVSCERARNPEARRDRAADPTRADLRQSGGAE